MRHHTFFLLAATCRLTASLIYDPEQTRWNLNQNQTATNPLDYSGQWPNHSKLLPTQGCAQAWELTNL